MTGTVDSGKMPVSIIAADTSRHFGLDQRGERAALFDRALAFFGNARACVWLSQMDTKYINEGGTSSKKSIGLPA